MPRLPIMLTAVLLSLLASGVAPALGQTPAPDTPLASATASLADVAPLPLTGERRATFETYVTDMLEVTGVPGAAVAVVQDGEVVFQQGFGVRALGESAAVTPDTLMMIGSITKPLTATMAATVVDDRELSWDTPVVELLPAFAVADPELTQRLTLRDAFCACTGLPQRDPEFLFTSATLTPERLITSVGEIPLTAPPGEQFQYSNQMFAIGGYAAAAAALPDAPELFDAYDAAMRQRLLDPLGMRESTFSLDEVLASGNWAQPHGLDLEGRYHPVSLADDERHVLSVAPAGALWSSAAEMARFVQMELAGGVAADQTRVVSRTNLAETWQPQVSLAAPGSGEQAPGFPPELVTMAQGYALGWVTGDYHGQPLLWHSGGTFGFSSQVALLPEANLGLVILTNGINAEYFKLGVQFRLFELLFDQPETIGPMIDAAMAAQAEQIVAMRPFFESVDPVAVAPYLGHHTHPVLGDVTISPGHDGTLLFDAGEFQAVLRAFRDPQSGAISYLSSDLPLAGVTTVTFTQEGGEPVMTFTDPTTGEEYRFTVVGTASSAATPPT